MCHKQEKPNLLQELSTQEMPNGRHVKKWYVQVIRLLLKSEMCAILRTQAEINV